MRSEAQIEASRRNGAISRGPTTSIGKRVSSLNATKHGLYAQTVCIPFEDRDKFQSLVNAYTAEYNPATPTEASLVEAMASAKWRELRAISYEAGLIEAAARRNRDAVKREFGDAGPVLHGALAFSSFYAAPGLRLLDRYETRHSRAWFAARAELLKAQARREKLERTQEVVANTEAPLRIEPGEPEVGFVATCLPPVPSVDAEAQRTSRPSQLPRDA